VRIRTILRCHAGTPPITIAVGTVTLDAARRRVEASGRRSSLPAPNSTCSRQAHELARTGLHPRAAAVQCVGQADHGSGRTVDATWPSFGRNLRGRQPYPDLLRGRTTGGGMNAWFRSLRGRITLVTVSVAVLAVLITGAVSVRSCGSPRSARAALPRAGPTAESIARSHRLRHAFARAGGASSPR
jgi:hypothetical protein